MISSFTRFVPVIIGCGALGRLGEQAKEKGLHNVLVVYDEIMAKLGVAPTAIKSLKDAGITVIEYPEIIPEPTDEIIEKGARLALEKKVDGIIGIGGGSSMDAAKCINILCGNPSPISNYYVGPNNKPTKPGLTLILIPTTAGTGSECTISAVVTDTVNKRKAVIRSRECCLAHLAIVDPELTAHMPKSLTATTGIDAFAQAAEAITIRPENTNPVSEIFAKEAIRLLTKYLPLAIKDGSNMAVREKVMIAATVSGFAFSNTLCHLGHAMAHSVGAYLHLPHGDCCGAVLPEVMDYVADVVPDKVRIVGESMGLIFADNATPKEIGEKTAAAIRKFRTSIELPALKDFGVTREKVIEASKLVHSDGCYFLTPKEISEDELKKMLGRVYDNVS